MSTQFYRVKVRPLSTQELREFKHSQQNIQSDRANVQMNDVNSCSGLHSPPGEGENNQMNSDIPNTVIAVKNTETLDEYQIEGWVQKRKYRVDETLQDLKLEVGGLFEFQLQRSQKSDAELIREELMDLRKEKQNLMRENKLFLHYYLQYWDDKMRKNITSKDYMVEAIVESAQNLYHQCDGLAFLDDLDSGSKKSHRQQPQSQQQLGEEWFEVFITGKGVPHSLAYISSRVMKKVNVPIGGQIHGNGLINSRYFEDNCNQEVQVYHLHKINIQLTQGANYIVYTPKIFY
ncbi:UNKNOWN [Stylonychia lemnae]|uniref:Uncharacterized protein n=1 Tax=Stylonychia lemnae TaxID=5949 RepID=A0A078AUM6_STYLE|nr:UNKNOWN [Stylonychia lemnae]|eukprot:CDW85721.1 UNKNOWN [Stylonychia lemnae]